MLEILKTICCCGDCGMTWCMKRTTWSCADLHGLPFPAVPKTAVGIACNQNKAVFLSLPACLPVSLVILQQKDLWSQWEEQKDKGYWPERIWGQLQWSYQVLKCFFSPPIWELCERRSFTIEVLSHHRRYIAWVWNCLWASTKSYPETNKLKMNSKKQWQFLR